MGGSEGWEDLKGGRIGRVGGSEGWEDLTVFQIVK